MAKQDIVNKLFFYGIIGAKSMVTSILGMIPGYFFAGVMGVSIFAITGSFGTVAGLLTVAVMLAVGLVCVGFAHNKGWKWK